jgi:anti-sigma regulatory factor (Ser/Thr protein kinase)
VSATTENQSPVLTVVIPTTLEHVRPVRKILEGLLGCEGWGEDDVADAGLVATEVIQNAVEHGSRNDGTEHVEVRCSLEAGAFLVEVADPGTGKGPAVLLARDVTHAPPLDASRGRGLYLVHRMSQRMERLLGPGGGSVVRVRLAVGGAS